MSDKFYLNDTDKRLIKDGLRRIDKQPLEGQRYPNSFPDTPNVDTNAAPEVYVALTTTSITAAVTYNSEVITPGVGTVEVHYLVERSGKKFSKVANLKYTVYNISAISISSGVWVKILKDKFGTWVVESQVSGITVKEVDGTPTVNGVTELRFDQSDGFQVTEVSPGIARIDFTASGGETRPIPCGWLENVQTTSCWTVYRRGGKGKCTCFEEDDIDDPYAGIIAQYTSALSGWLAVRPNPNNDSAMIETCCGCGSLLFKIDPVTFVGTLKLGGVHGACDDNAVYTKTLTEYVCGELDGGLFRYIEFFGYDVADACDEALADCVNEYRIMLVCGAECPPAACICAGCGADTAPVAWYALGITGFTDVTFNGDWVWHSTATACTWNAVCEGGTSVLSYSIVTGKWTLTHGGSVYEIAIDADQCGEGMTLSRVSGSASPSTIGVLPVIGAGPEPDCVCCADEPGIETLTATFSGGTGTLTGLNGSSVALAFSTPTYTSSSIPGAPGANPASVSIECTGVRWEAFGSYYEGPGGTGFHTLFGFSETQVCDPVSITILLTSDDFSTILVTLTITP